MDVGSEDGSLGDNPGRTMEIEVVVPLVSGLHYEIDRPRGFWRHA